mmetsp:Transcript_31553/g.78834  ORF Transcript_31553/g.78834 Transcript_31553/m.78834 type:complete len:1227 (+) Transcript_31553:77-3757(+)
MASAVARAAAPASAIGKLPQATPSSVKGAWTMAKLAAAYALGLCLINQSAVVLPLGVVIAAMALSGLFLVGVDCSRGSFFPYKAANDFVGFLVLLPLLRSVSSVRESPKMNKNVFTRMLSSAQHSGLALALVATGVSAALYHGRVVELVKYWVVPLLCMHLQLGTFTESTSRGSWPSYMLLHPEAQSLGHDSDVAKAASSTPAYAIKQLHLANQASSSGPHIPVWDAASFAGMWASLVRFVIVSGKREFFLWPIGAALGILASPWAQEILAINNPPVQLTMTSTTDWMRNHYEVPFALVGGYLAAIFIGTKLMERQEAWDLKLALAGWNFLLSVGSITGFVFASHLAINALRTQGPHALACNNSIWWGNPSVMLFCLSKVPELVDTAFIVLRKKPLHFLHYYHHATVLLFCWDAWVVNNPVGGMFAIMNLFVHSIMYAYYCAAAIGVRFPQILRQNITNIQLAQMVAGCSLCIYNMCNCNLTARNNTYGLAMYASYFALFLNFWVQQYIILPKKKAAAAKTLKEGTAEAKIDANAPRTSVLSTGLNVNGAVQAEVLLNEGGSKYFLSAINYPMATYVFLIHALACWGLALTFSSQSKTLAWGFILWPISGFGITGGAHRLWAHKAYKAYMPYRIVTMIANSIANQGTLYHWTRDHRTHHLHSETDADPHNALRGFFFAHVGWLLLKKRAAVYEAGKKVDMSDILTDPVCEIQRKLDPLWNMFWCFIMPALVAKYGWGETFGKGLLVCGFLRYCIVLHFTWLVNSAAHLYGDRPYDEKSNPAENLTVAIASLGEGWHNWHHKYAFDYAASELGIHYQFNPTKLIIDFGWLIGQTYDHRRASDIWTRELKRKDEKENASMGITLGKGDDAAITLRSIKNCIPKDCFEYSYVTSFTHLFEDIAIIGGAAAATLYAQQMLPSWVMLLAWPTYWFYTGLVGTGLWVLAHECGHGGFSASQKVNDVVGFIVHSFLLTPYYSWQITHAKHHRRTNHLTDGETWVPSAGNADSKKAQWFKSHQGTIFRIALVWAVGWWFYLLNNDTGARKNKGQSHFDPKARGLFSPKEEWKVRASNGGMVAMLGVLGYACKVYGFYQVAMVYLVPQVIVNVYLTCITFMQHTHELVPHYDDKEWTWLRGALATLDRSMGAWYDRRLHHITDSHVCHHLFSDMPFYGAKKATPYIKEHCGVHHRAHISTFCGSVYLGFWRDFYTTMKACLVVGENGADHFWYFK